MHLTVKRNLNKVNEKKMTLLFLWPDGLIIIVMALKTLELKTARSS